MKTLLLSTALAAALGTGAMAQTTTGTTDTGTATTGTTTGTAARGPFYADQTSRGVRASDLIGTRLYAAETGVTNEVNGIDSGWNDIGEVNDVIVSRDGKVEAVLVDIGGFLGIGERQVAVSMDALRFASDSATADDPDDWFLVMQADRATLEAAPEYDREAAARTAVPADTTAAVDTTAAGTQTATPEGYTSVAAADLTSEMLDGATVMDRNDENVGTVSNLVIGADGKITDVIVDVGGFLGLGSKPVSLKLGDLDILREDGGETLRVYVSATKEQLEAMPEAAL